MKTFIDFGRTAIGAMLLSCLSVYGTPAFATDESPFPALTSSYLKTGDFIGPDHVRRITPGLNKDQVRLELGSPHFSEGIFGVGAWDYVFNFYKGKTGNDYVTCQFKVRFTNDNLVEATHWKGPDCADYITPPVAPTVVVAPPLALPLPLPALPVVLPVVLVPKVAAPRRRVVLAADGMFAVGKSDLAAPSRAKLDALVDQVKQARVVVSSVMVTGHTDRMGSHASNLALSVARANTVRDYLVSGGLDSKVVQAQGVGAVHPVVDCPGSNFTPKLAACLQANRRVEIEFVGEE